ncbi:MAG: P-loop NTPase fold protein [Thermodesulfobacteriota bacterium]
MSERQDTTNRPHPFSADRPIELVEQDRLGRHGFADSIATALTNWKGKDSLVVALYGPWGTGKTSIKNMVVETLNANSSEAPTIVDFNPWQWAGQDEMVRAFFSEIGSALSRTDRTEVGRKRVARWQSYAARLKMWSFLAESLRKAMAWLFFALAIVSGGGLLIGSRSSVALTLVFLLTLGSAAVLRWGTEFVGNLAVVFDRKLALEDTSLAEAKKDLSTLLLQLSIPVLVIIDDIDRLSKQEIKLLFQLIKANADFPNMVYFLLFQRDIVEQALDESVPTKGKEFLEKIVQVGFDTPAIDRSKLEKVLFSKLDEILGSESIGKRFDSHRWGNIYIGGLHAFFGTLRDVNRFSSSLAFHLSLFQGRKAFEVNPIDVIALEAVRVFEPEIYKGLSAAKAGLLGLDRIYERGDEAAERTRKAIDSLLEKADLKRREVLKELLHELFPHTRNIGYGADFGDEWYRDLRICHEKVFDRYFQFAVSEKDLSQSDLEEILEAVGNRHRLVTELKSLNER